VDAALAAAREAVVLARRTGDSLRIAQVLVYAAQCSVRLRDPAGAASFAEEAMARAKHHGFAQWEWRARSILGWVCALQAGARVGVSEIREGIASARSLGEERLVPWLLGQLSEGELATGDPNAAAEAANEAFRWGERNTLYNSHGYLHYTRGDAMVALGDRVQAEADYHRVLAWSRECSEKWHELNAALRLARLWQADGRTGDARDVLAPVYGWFTEGFDNPVLRDAKALLEELTGTFDCTAISDAKTEKLVWRREHWMEKAKQAPTEAIRAQRLNVAHLYEVDAKLTERALRHIAESRDLIAKADTILGGH
jgi:tetratricopeptide (TPR) repeat protein